VIADSLPSHAAVAGELQRLAIGVDADELHGSLCGYLSAGGERLPTEWPGRLALDPIDDRHLAPDRPLGQLYGASLAQLDDDGLGFSLLLPDEATVEVRAEALLGWCRGFIGGFGLAQGQASSDDAEEALADLARIASSGLTFEDPEQDEEALEELVEFVRVAVLLLRSECGPPPPRATTLH